MMFSSILYRGLSLLLVGSTALTGTAFAAAHAPVRKTAAAGSSLPQPPSGGMPELRIAAVVNDDVISVLDLISRMKMVLASSNIPDSPDARKRIAQQVLRTMVDEKLEMQEAKKKNVSASDEELNKALSQIEKQNNMQPGQLEAFLQSKGIDKNALINQLTASIVWAKLVRREASETTEVTDQEVEDAFKRLKEHAGEPQSRVAEIFLAVDNPQQEDEVKKQAERLTEQMKQGARFSAVAQQYSQSATAAVGGDIGWIRPDQLSPELGKAVASLKPGELSQPIRTQAGYYLLLVLERRTGSTGGGEPEPVLDIVQVVFPLPQQASDGLKKAAIAEAEKIRTAATSCPEMLRAGKEKAPQLSSEGKLRLSEISPNMRTLIAKLTVGKPSDPIVQKNGVGVIMVCGKTTTAATAGAPTRDEVADTLVRERVETLARRYLRDLRRVAFVDVRV